MQRAVRTAPRSLIPAYECHTKVHPSPRKTALFAFAVDIRRSASIEVEVELPIMIPQRAGYEARSLRRGESCLLASLADTTVCKRVEE